MKQGADYSARNSSFSTIFARTTKAQKYFRNRGSNWFSSSLMAQFVGEDGHVTTIDRFDVMIKSEENLSTPRVRRKGHSFRRTSS